MNIDIETELFSEKRLAYMRGWEKGFKKALCLFPDIISQQFEQSQSKREGDRLALCSYIALQKLNDKVPPCYEDFIYDIISEVKDRMKPYSEQLKDPRWQKRRLEIFQRDNWTCTSCGRADRCLHIHHRKYLPRLSYCAWEYPDELLITLCESCHSNKHDEEEDITY